MRAALPSGAIALALAALATGCVPYALPPMSGAVGVLHASPAHAGAGIHVELAASPLQLVPSLHHRVWDVTLAGTFDHVDHDAWGIQLATGPMFHPWGDDPTASHTTRWMPELVARWSQDGYAAGVRATVEKAAFYDRSGDTSNGWGVAFGEAAIGLYVESDYLLLDRARGWSLSAGLTFRLPGLLGVACCADLD